MPLLTRVCVVVVMLAGLCWSQATTSAATSSAALALLQQAGKRYADAKSYHIDEVEESNSRTELSREWHKSLTTAIQEPSNRYRYEAHSSNGSRIHISDGKTEWVYDVESNSYTQHPASADGPSTPLQMLPADLGEFNARKLRKSLADLGTDYQSAQKLPEETLTIGDQAVPCDVVKVTSQNLKKPGKPGTVFERTIWIENDNHWIRKIVTRRHNPTMLAPAIFEDVDITDSYPVIVLDAPIAADVFTFIPPQTAKLVEQFPSPFDSPGEDLTNQPAPEVKLTSPDGHEVTLASFRGKPVLIDFWATWCLPCVVSLPQLNGIYQQVKDKGLTFISVDEDEDAKTATDFLAKKQIPWSDFHDSGEIGKAFHKSGLPLTVLVDSQGKVVYYETGYSDGLSSLRAAIAKLGPEYAALSQPAPPK